jgi:hypothetical protein
MLGTRGRLRSGTCGSSESGGRSRSWGRGSCLGGAGLECGEEVNGKGGIWAVWKHSLSCTSGIISTIGTTVGCPSFAVWF